MPAVFLPDIFGAYLSGRRAAITDNWNDLKDYNAVLKGQLSNAYDMATFGDRVRQNAGTAMSQMAQGEQQRQRAVYGGYDLDTALRYLAQFGQGGTPANPVQTGVQQGTTGSAPGTPQSGLVPTPPTAPSAVDPVTGAPLPQTPTPTTQAIAQPKDYSAMSDEELLQYVVAGVPEAATEQQRRQGAGV